MSTVNGIGTLRYGWKWRSDNTAEATTWFVIGFFPVIPIRRSRIQVLDTGELNGVFYILAGSAFNSQIRELETLPFDWSSIACTYLKGYMLVPLLLLLPMIVVLGCMLTVHRFTVPEQRNQLFKGPVLNAMMIGFGLGMTVYWGVVVSKILDRASGRRVLASRRHQRP